MRILLRLVVFSLYFFFVPVVFAHEETAVVESLFPPAVTIVTIAGIIIGAMVLFSFLVKSPGEKLKRLIFGIIVVVAVVATIYSIFLTIYENVRSVTKGPVHWHADFRIFHCGEELDIIDPKGLANRVGTSLLHEHGDNRIHIEGTVSTLERVLLHRFFEDIGGSFTNGEIILPTNDGQKVIRDGDVCNDGKEGMWQVFLYTTKNGEIHQREITEFAPSYIISPETVIPPGDCLIFEFLTDRKEQTEKMCSFYEIALKKGELKMYSQ